MELEAADQLLANVKKCETCIAMNHGAWSCRPPSYKYESVKHIVYNTTTSKPNNFSRKTCGGVLKIQIWLLRGCGRCLKAILQTRAPENFRSRRWGAERRVPRARTRERGPPSAWAEYWRTSYSILMGFQKVKGAVQIWQGRVRRGQITGGGWNKEKRWMCMPGPGDQLLRFNLIWPFCVFNSTKTSCI